MEASMCHRHPCDRQEKKEKYLIFKNDNLLSLLFCLKNVIYADEV